MSVNKMIAMLLISYVLSGCASTPTHTARPMPSDLQPTLQQQNQAKFDRATTF